MQEIGVGDEISIPLDTLQEHRDYKFKIQTKSVGRWVDRVNYARLLPESETEEGIKYLFYPSKGSDKLLVVFQAINRKPGYNYVRTLSGVNAHDYISRTNMERMRKLTVILFGQRPILRYCR
jgi:hypothetical protein